MTIDAVQFGRIGLCDMKICCQCKIPKQFTDFYKNAGKPDGLQGMCITCTKQNDKKRVGSEENKKRSHLYYHSVTVVKMKNPDFRRKYNTHRTRPKRTKAYRERQRQKYATNLQQRLSQTLRTRIRAAIVTGCPKSAKTLELLGCDIRQLKDWLSKQFAKGMSWDNYGEWHIDHITPKSVFRDTNEAFRKCWSLRNLQPLWAKENMRKEGERRALYWTDSIIRKWNEGKTVKEIDKEIPLSEITIRYIIKKQIGNKAYKKRCSNNMKKAQSKTKQTRVKNRAKREEQIVIIREQINNLIKTKNISISKIAHKSNISDVAIYNFLNGKTQMRTYNLEKILNILNNQ